MKETMMKLETEKEEGMVEELAQIVTLMTDDKKRRNLELEGEKGAGAAKLFSLNQPDLFNQSRPL